MAKKTKKAKTPKAPKGRGGGKDSITGLKWNLDGFGTIESDKVYDTNSTAGKEIVRLGGWDTPPTQTFIEFELSNNYILITESYFFSNGHRELERMALQGNFKYKNQQLSAASIDLVCSNSATFFDNGQFMGNSGGINYSSGESRNILNPNSIQALSGWGWSSKESSHFIEGQIEGSAPDSSLWLNVGDKSEVRAFGQGKFFQEGWWNNPFTHNLI